ncbi:MAG: rod shape-determining protein MreD [Paracoccaceae bacterium]
MAETSRPRLWTRRAMYLLLAVAIVFFQLLPLDTMPPRWAPPDLLMALTLAWAARRPEYVPALSIAAAFVLADLLLQRPPGLLALLAVLATEWLKRRARSLRDASFATEWAQVAGALVAVTLAYRLTLAILLVPQPPLGLSLIQMLMTLAFYPAVVMVSHLVLGVRKPLASDLDGPGLRP